MSVLIIKIWEIRWYMVQYKGSKKNREMNDDEFDKFCKFSILDYSQDLIKSGACNEENALDCTKKEFNEILPQGKDTANNFIYVMENTQNEYIGYIWYEKCSENEGFICDFLILEKFRKKGYGKQTLILLENQAKEKKINRLSLSVFKFNEPAFSLYNCLGYKTFKEDSESMYMMKEI